MELNNINKVMEYFQGFQQWFQNWLPLFEKPSVREFRVRDGAC